MSHDLGCLQTSDGIGHGGLRDQTVVNIRERGGRRKQTPVTRPESRSERIRSFFGILGKLERFCGLEGRYELAILLERARA